MVQTQVMLGGNWPDDDSRLVKIGGEEHVCDDAVFYSTVKQMEYARLKLGKKMPDKRFFSIPSADLVLESVKMKRDAIFQQVMRSFSLLVQEIIMRAYEKKEPPLLPVFMPDYGVDYVNHCVEYIAPIAKIEPLAPATAFSAEPPKSVPETTADADKWMGDFKEYAKAVVDEEGRIVKEMQKMIEINEAVMKFIGDDKTA